MIISRTPLRISFVGGGTDIHGFYKKKKGCVLSTSINKYVYVMAHPFFNSNQILLKYSKTELVDNVSKINHPIFREVLRFLKIKGGIEITTNADVPTGTGLGSSSSFTVGLLNCLYAYKGVYVSRERLAQEACHIEINMLHEPIGKQDQYIASFGNLNMIDFHPDETVSVNPIIMSDLTKRKLGDNLLMFFTGMQRSARTILKNQIKNMNQAEKFKILEKMAYLAEELKSKLNKNDLNSFGKILDMGWQLKKKLSPYITNSFIDKVYSNGIKNGALGGKLLGAGGGGFLLFYAEKNNHEKIRKSMMGLVELPLNLDFEGSKIIYYSED